MRTKLISVSLSLCLLAAALGMVAPAVAAPIDLSNNLSQPYSDIVYKLCA